MAARAPHYLVVGIFLGGIGYAVYGVVDPSGSGGSWPVGGGLIQLLALIAGVALLVTGRYPRGVFDLLLGLHRWVLRVAAYAALMTDAYPPFRLDLGDDDPADLPLAGHGVAPGAGPDRPQFGTGWSTGRVVAVVIGSLLVVSAAGTGTAGTVLMVADRGRDAAGFVTTGPIDAATPGYALVLDPVILQQGPDGPDLRTVLGDVRVAATAPGAGAIFVGIGPAEDVEAYLGGVERGQLTDATVGGRTGVQLLPGGAPVAPPAAQGFWVASDAGPGARQVTWAATEGQWALVVMNADGSRPVAADMAAGVTAPMLHGLWTALYATAALVLVAGVLLVALALPRSAHRAA